jgi:spermidine synthase
VAGTLVTGFILMDALSIGTISAFLGMLGAGIAILIAGFGGMDRPRRRMIGALAGFAVLTIPLTSGAVFRDFYERLLANNVVNRGAAFVETVENRSGVINVDADLYAYGGGVYDGRIAIDLMNDQNILIRPFALSLSGRAIFQLEHPTLPRKRWKRRPLERALQSAANRPR